LLDAGLIKNMLNPLQPSNTKDLEKNKREKNAPLPTFFTQLYDPRPSLRACEATTYNFIKPNGSLRLVMRAGGDDAACFAAEKGFRYAKNGARYAQKQGKKCLLRKIFSFFFKKIIRSLSAD
jgi:hypothetical protein